MARLAWALARIEEARLPENLTSENTVQALVDALLAVRGSSTRAIFGLTAEALVLEAGDRELLDHRLRSALLASREAFARAGDAVALVELQKLAKTCDLPELALHERFALRCDPLGDASTLDARWQRIVARLARARAQSAPFRWTRVADYFEDNEPAQIELLTPDLEGLYEFALRYEKSSTRTFSRELAAVWSIVDGIVVDDLWSYLARVRDWRWSDMGLEVGMGHYLQGSLVIEVTDATDNLAHAPVIDRDDDGTEVYRYDNLGELLDRLLPGGTSSGSAGDDRPAKRSWWKRWGAR